MENEINCCGRVEGFVYVVGFEEGREERVVFEGLKGCGDERVLGEGVIAMLDAVEIDE
ncbi:hypothetical protein [Bacillus altitudinis]|uniref:hypothetical protein n=1 Tax=Bacillus altitudinis TaxID=293387 RepID=UPI001643E032|nr:hypothetical protein [Bacillus altitudinis]